MSGIIGYGSYIPRDRITRAEINQQLGKPTEYGIALGVDQKSVCAPNEDTFTMAVEASLDIFENRNTENGIRNKGKISELTVLSSTSPLAGGIKGGRENSTDHKSKIKNLKSKISHCFLASETPVYAVKPTSVMIASALGLPREINALDVEFACKAGTAALNLARKCVTHNEYALACAADNAQADPHDALYYTAAAGAASYLIGHDDDECLAVFSDCWVSLCEDRHDFWRHHGQPHPNHAGRFTVHSYDTLVTEAITLFLEQTRTKVEDYHHVVLHQPNAKLPRQVAKKIGITESQLAAGFIVPHTGNTYAANVPLALANALDHATPEQKILVCSYGSGSGSDCFALRTTELISKKE